MYLVNEFFIQPITKDHSHLPGMSYALLRNFTRGGLRCVLFFSHAWAEGVYEFIRNALVAWPEELRGDDCGAYICFLANPQNLDISKLVGSGVEASPFYRVLATQPPPRVIMVRATSVMITGPTPTHLPTRVLLPPA